MFSHTATKKINGLVDAIDKEVSWHGIVTHNKPDLYIISDILVHPQLSYKALVDTDETEYARWLYSHSPEIFTQIRFQGHSHVNMPVFSSSIDNEHQKSIVKQFSDPDDFYIFSVHNKRRDRLILLYEAGTQKPIEDKEISILQAEDNCGPIIEPLTSIPLFIEQSKKQIKNKSDSSLHLQRFLQKFRGKRRHLDWI